MLTASSIERVRDENSELDRVHSARALELAGRGIGLVSPNPLVGCVIVSSEGKVVGEGTYVLENVVHAEVIALEHAGTRVRGGTAYVSLEPHDHHGKTPPCTEALIEAGIARVVCPIEDPNPLVSGKGFERLRAAGVEVTIGILADEAARLNQSFIVWHREKRPFVHLKMAMSLDGRISVGRDVSTALTSSEGLAEVHRLRHSADAILIGSNTALVDDPVLTDRSALPRRRPLVRVILDDRLRLREGSQLAATASDTPTLIFSSSEDSAAAERLTKAGIELIASEGGVRNLKGVLAELRNRELQTILVEGGAETAAAFLDAGLVDKVTFIYSPVIFGGADAPSAVGGAGFKSGADAVRLVDVKVDRIGDDIFVTGNVMK